MAEKPSTERDPAEPLASLTATAVSKRNLAREARDIWGLRMLTSLRRVEDSPVSKEPSPSTTVYGKLVQQLLTTWVVVIANRCLSATSSARTGNSNMAANELARGASVTPAWKRLLRQFNNLLIYVLLVAAVLAGVLAEWLDMAVILAVVVVMQL